MRLEHVHERLALRGRRIGEHNRHKGVRAGAYLAPRDSGPHAVERRPWARVGMDFKHDYSAIDRALHRVAFATWPIQAAMADIEEQVFKAQLRDVAIDRPVFVAGLPRAGTTLLLEMIEGTGEFASYQYQDMPFLLLPMMWRNASRSGRLQIEARERAHGDGIAITTESPEAFEEVVWRTFWPKRYLKDRIRPWGKAIDPEFDTFFQAQMRKIIAIRRDERPTVSRYLSKNNGNIARLESIHRMFPDAVLLVPWRDPISQALSLLSQHTQFLELHGKDAFTRRYMEAIGHYDLGANLKPIDFGGWLGTERPAFAELEDWVAYWCAAYSFLAEQTHLPLYFVSYEAVCERPAESMAELEARLGVATAGSLVSQAGRVREPRAGAPVHAQFDVALRERAGGIVRRLEALPGIARRRAA